MLAGYFINPPGFVAATVALAFGLAAASFFPAIVMGIFSLKMNKRRCCLWNDSWNVFDANLYTKI